MSGITIFLILMLGWIQANSAAEPGEVMTEKEFQKWKAQNTSPSEDLDGWTNWMNQCTNSLNLKGVDIVYDVPHPAIQSTCTSKCYAAAEEKPDWKNCKKMEIIANNRLLEWHQELVNQMGQCVYSLRVKATQITNGVVHPEIQSKCTSQCYDSGQSKSYCDELALSASDGLQYSSQHQEHKGQKEQSPYVIDNRTNVQDQRAYAQKGKLADQTVTVVNPTTTRRGKDYTGEHFLECMENNGGKTELCFEECKKSGRGNTGCFMVQNWAAGEMSNKRFKEEFKAKSVGEALEKAIEP